MANHLMKRLRFLSELGPAGQVVLRDEHRTLTLAQLIDAAERLASRLRAFNARVVALRAGNSVDWVVVDFACQFSELVFVPLPDYFSDQQVRHCLDTMNVDVLLADDENLTGLLDQYDRETEMEAWGDVTPYYAWTIAASSAAFPVLPPGTHKVTFTSGSTGNPKGVCLSSEHQWRVAESLADAIALQAPRHLCVLPLATLLENIGGIYTPLLCGGEVILPGAEQRGFMGSSGLDAQRFLQCLSQAQPNTLILIPQLLQLLVAACRSGWQAPSSLAFVAVGGGKVAPNLLVEAAECGLPVYEGYGLSECGSVVALNTAHDHKVGTVGRVLPHCHVTISDREIQVSGANFLGYVNDPASWYPEKVCTGDLGDVRDGYLLVNGRRKNLLISSFGRNINPEWVESEIAANPAISQCVVLGDQKPYLTALLGTHPGMQDADVEQWLAEANRKLPDYAQVKAWARLGPGAWRELATANGRPRRDLIGARYDTLIASLYQSYEQATQHSLAHHAGETQ